ncbi:MAG: TRAP transporter small permease [Hoeflea sp.]|uniref:TRAP transporter small permease n=1 Tax=Hoeflea sp. TaxID=1940281 RepID=UPI003EF3AC7C
MRKLVGGIRCIATGLAVGANVIGTTFILLLVVIMNVDVVARGVFHAPLRGTVEVVIFSLVLIVFLQLPNVVEGGKLTRSDGFLLLVQSTRPKVSHLASRVIDAVSCVFMAMITWTMYPEFLDSFGSCSFFVQPDFGGAPTGSLWGDVAQAWGRCDYFGTPGVFTAPWWPAKLAILFGVGLSSILFLLKALMGSQYGDPLRQPENDPSNTHRRQP